MATSLTDRMVRGTVALGLLLGAGLTVTACSEDPDLTRDDLLEKLAETNVGDTAFNECLADELFDLLEQDQVDEFYDASDASLSDETTAALQEASATCAARSASVADSDEDVEAGDAGSSGDTTTGG